MVVVEHRGDAVEAEPVEVELVEPVFAVGEQEVNHFVLAVVEAERVPRRVLPPVVAVEILVVGAVEAAQTLDLVLHGVRVHDVHDDGDAAPVSVVDEGLQVVGGTESRRGGKEARHVVAERAVIGVLLYGHNLYGVVAVGIDARQNLLAKFVIGAHLLLLLGHTDVAFVDEQGRSLGFEVGLGEGKGLFGVPDLSREDIGLGVLHHAGSPGGYAFALPAVPVDRQLVEVEVMQCLEGKLDFPHAVPDSQQFVLRLFFPVREGTNQVDGVGVGSPFAEYPMTFFFVKAEVEVSVGKFREVAAAVGQFGHFF